MWHFVRGIAAGINGWGYFYLSRTPAGFCEQYVCLNFRAVTNLMHKFLYPYNVTILYMFRAVLCSSSGGHRMYTAYGIVTLYEWSWWSCNTLVERELRGL